MNHEQSQIPLLWKADQGDGTYHNPILYADYSDPDVIAYTEPADGTRSFVMTASSFNYTPGLPLLHSKDLVNWTLVNHALPIIGLPAYQLPRHACGVWAPAIRFHRELFYIYYGMPDEGIFVLTASKLCGSFTEPVCILPGKGYIDPCPIFLPDGSAYLVHGYAKSRIGFNSMLGIVPLRADGLAVCGEDHLLYDGSAKYPTLEGPKLYRRNGYFYIFAPAGGVAHGWQVVLRARDIYGPYEDAIVLRQGDTAINGPHQGAWVEDATGSSWFLHFQATPAHGRILHLQPMHWEEDWPVIGRNGLPVSHADKPYADCTAPILPYYDDFSDDFQSSVLGLQWQWPADASFDFYSVGGGILTLYPHFYGDDLFRCPNILTQMLICPTYTASCVVDGSDLLTEEAAGLCLLGNISAALLLYRTTDNERYLLFRNGSVQTKVAALPQDSTVIHMQISGDPTGLVIFAYRFDTSECFHPVPAITVPGHTWVGVRIGLVCIALREKELYGNAHFAAYQLTNKGSITFGT